MAVQTRPAVAGRALGGPGLRLEHRGCLVSKPYVSGATSRFPTAAAAHADQGVLQARGSAEEACAQAQSRQAQEGEGREGTH